MNLWYNKAIQTYTHDCFQCGSPLIFVSEKTELPEGSKFPQTVVIYRCSNQTCQDEKDRETRKRKKLQKGKDLITKQRLAAKKSSEPKKKAK